MPRQKRPPVLPLAASRKPPIPGKFNIWSCDAGEMPAFLFFPLQSSVQVPTPQRPRDLKILRYAVRV